MKWKCNVRNFTIIGRFIVTNEALNVTSLKHFRVVWVFASLRARSKAKYSKPESRTKEDKPCQLGFCPTHHTRWTLARSVCVRKYSRQLINCQVVKCTTRIFSRFLTREEQKSNNAKEWIGRRALDKEFCSNIEYIFQPSLSHFPFRSGGHKNAN